MSNYRSALYARVSTQNEEQDTSYHNQQKIKVEGYDIVKTYADRGSGTQVYNRENFKKLLYDCGIDLEKIRNTKTYNFIASDREPLYEAIVVSHTSRFLRNQVMMKTCINALRKKNVEIYFADLGKSSLDKDIDFVMNILFLLDEQESLNTSQKVRRGLERARREKQYIQVASIFGYNYIKEENRLIINEPEAEVVRKIYSMYLEGNGYRKIYDYLQEYYPQYPKKLSHIAYILRNEKYAGYNAYGKWSVNKIEGYKKRNKEYEIFKSDRIEPIVSYEDWCKVQEIISSKKLHTRGLKANTYPLSRKIVCDVCGSTYYRQLEVKGNYSRVYWICREKKQYGAKNCHSAPISEKKLIELIMSEDYGIKSFIRTIELQVNCVLNNMEEVDTSEIEEKLKQVKVKQERMFDSYIEGVTPKDIYNRKQLQLNSEENILNEQLSSLKDKNRAIEDIKNISETYKEKLDNYYKLMQEGKYDEVYNDINKIVIGVWLKQINDDGEVKVIPMLKELKFKGFESLDKLFEGRILIKNF